MYILLLPGIKFIIIDERDPLKDFRVKFNIPRRPPHTDECEESVYLCGNSLGAMPKSVEEIVREEMGKWGLAGVEGHTTGKIHLS